MSIATVEAEIQVTLDGKVQIQDTIELPEDKHYKLELVFTQVECTCPEPAPVPAKSETISVEEELDALPVGSILADKDHDDWEKAISGDWVHKDGPHLRSKTLVALWAPFTVVSVGT